MKYLLIFFSTLSLTTKAYAGDLTIHIEDIRNDKGRMQIAVFNDEKSFDEQNETTAFAAISLNAHRGKQKVTLHNIPTGKYAIALHHDENVNGKFDLNERTFPKEGFAYSNNVGEDKEVTTFTDASFEQSDINTIQNIKMIYIK